MSEERDSVVKALQELNSSIDSVSKRELYSLTSRIASILERFYSRESAYQKDFKYIRNSLSIIVDSDSDDQPFGPGLAEIRTLCHQLLESMLSETTSLGLPSRSDKKVDSSIHIHNTLTQEQNQSTQITVVLESIREHLTGGQYKELREILLSEKDASKAKSAVLNRLKDFGSDVCSNVIAGLITNPQVWQAFIA